LKYRKMEWSDTVVNTMRSGLTSRLNELGLVKREKFGKNIRYHMTDTGKKYIRNLSGKEEIKHVTKEYRGQNEMVA
jgi:DNA-binding transcriptional regulator PaaX